MSKTTLLTCIIAGILGLQQFYHKVTKPMIAQAMEQATTTQVIEQEATIKEQIDKIKIENQEGAIAYSSYGYESLFEKLTEGYSTEARHDLEKKVNEFADSVYKEGVNYASQFRYLLPKDNEKLFLSLFALEGFGKPNAVSPTGKHVGLGQLSEEVAKAQGLRIIRKGNKIVYNECCIPDLNVKASLAYYNKLYSGFGRHDLTLLAYNHGPAAVEAALKKRRATTAADVLKKFKHKKFNYLIKILGYAQAINSEHYSTPQFNQCFETRKVKNEKNLSEIARNNGISLKKFLACNSQFRDSNYCKPGLFYIVPKTEVYALAQAGKTKD